ncbi:kinetochore-associated Ndc80 complex subunit SPC24 Ecym_6094 [Eremothecium cymbalariae DBVPG|uniref:Kinetochore protein Spc24 n=1 Tax=Eremothecium cymbalariae (strain CBS 270.75 / DBVPG 7215 / KCTC 17166 / NRRL Y-17582) TaxID=931890 RepID=G8JV11_ERECY|nr:hypothetical protein Ecym_6094 [Eremothecium cymbalariae DBVPG\
MPSNGTAADVLENPAELLRQTRQNFSISHDLQLLSASEENLKRISHRTQQLQSKSAQELSFLQSQLNERSKAMDAIRATQASESQHLNTLMQSQELITLSKDLEQLENQIIEIRNELDQGMSQLLQSSDISTASSIADIEKETQKALQSPEVQTNLLKLQLFSSLGVLLDTEHNQALIERGDNAGIDTITLEDSSLSPYFRTKYVWDRL